MGGGRIGEMVFNDPPGSFGAMSTVEKMEFEQGQRNWRRQRRQQKLQEIAVQLAGRIEQLKTEETGENNG